MDQLKEVIQLGENIDMPDGYNWVEIFGTGDERKIGTIPLISVSSSVSTMLSDSIAVAAISIKVTSYESLTPFRHQPDIIEKVTPSASDRFQITTGKWIAGSLHVYEDEAMTLEVPWDVHIGNRIKISDNFIAVRRQPWVPPGYTGFIFEEAWVKYTSAESVTVSCGKKQEDPNVPGYVPWWLNPTKAPLPENECNGDFFENSDGTDQNTTLEVMIPDTSSNTTTVVTYFKPDSGDSGIAYVYGEYDGGYASARISVEAGSPGVGNPSGIQLTAKPDIISPPENSIIEALITSADGYPITGRSIHFTIQSGNGSLQPGTVILEETEETEETTSSFNTNNTPPTHTVFSLSKPVIRIISIDNLANAPWKWNRHITPSSASEMNLDVSNAFSDTAPVTLRVVYVTGGKATTNYVPRSGNSGSFTPDYGAVNRIRGTVGNISNTCTVTIGDRQASIYPMTLEAESPLRTGTEPDAEETGINGAWGWVKVVATEPVKRRSKMVDDGAGGHWDVTPTFSDPYPGYEGTGPLTSSSKVVPTITGFNGDKARGKGSFSLGLAKTKEYPDAIGDITGSRTCTVTYPIDHVHSVKRGGEEFTIDRWDGNTIWILDQAAAPGAGFGATSGSCEVNYVAGGICEGIYKSAPLPAEDPDDPMANDGYTVVLSVDYEGQHVTANVDVGSPYTGQELTITADPTDLNFNPDFGGWGEYSTIVGKLVMGVPPVAAVGRSVTFKLISTGRGFISQQSNYNDTGGAGPESITMKTGDDGTATIYLHSNTALNPGPALITITGPDDLQQQVSVEIKQSTTSSDTKTIEVLLARIVGSVDPINKVVALDGGADVSNWGAAYMADKWGGISGKPNGDQGPMIIEYWASGIAPWNIKGYRITGAKLKYDEAFNVGGSPGNAITGGLELEVPWSYTINNSRTYPIRVRPEGLTDFVPGTITTVQIAGKTATLGADGIAYFKDLPVGDHPVYIDNANFTPNRKKADGTGEADADTKNDTYKVGETSSQPYLVKKQDITIEIYVTIEDVFMRSQEQPPPWPAS